jgi:hypothetical protein
LSEETMKTTGHAVVLLIALASPLVAQPPPRPLPSDPLTAEETQRLVRVATEFAQSREGLGRENFVLVGTELVDYKPPRTEPRHVITPEEAGRHGSVLFFRYDKNAGVRVLVDLVRNAGVEVTTIPARAMPIGREEVERAARLALADPGVGRFVGADASRFRVAEPGSAEENTVEGLRVIAPKGDDPCSTHRCVDLFFRREGYYVTGQRVTVDLTANTVRVSRGPQ